MKVAIVTGAASGIGQALCAKYAARGVAVVGGYYPSDPHDPDTTARAVHDAGGKCVMQQVDVQSEGETETFAETALKNFGRLDYVVANAGLIRGSAFPSMTEDQWLQMINVNLSGSMRALRAGSRRISDEGSMIAVSSFLGSCLGWQNYAAYSAAKAGIVGLCRSLAVEFAPRGIRCNSVIPGLIETPQSLDPVNSVGPDGLAEMAPTIPVKRVGQAAEVAAVISFLTSDEASYVTGQAIAVDGGLTTAWNKS